MTDVRDSLLEQLRSLKEARLPDGFEERLELRLAAAERELRESAAHPWKLRRGLFLLAAIAVPTAAFASSAWWAHQRAQQAAVATAAPRIESVAPSSRTAKAALAQPSPAASEDTRTPAEVPAAKQSPTRVASSRPVTRRKATVSKMAPRSATVDHPSGSSSSPLVTTERTPAKIESLQVSAPARLKGSTNTSRRPDMAGATLGLRSSTAQSSGRAELSREQGTERRSAASERRTHESAQQGRERVQSRERKGQ